MCMLTKLIRQSAESDNKVAEASIDLAECYSHLGDVPKAIEMFDDAAKYAKRYRTKMRIHNKITTMLGERPVMAVYNR